jgi:hypothetical protein
LLVQQIAYQTPGTMLEHGYRQRWSTLRLCATVYRSQIEQCCHAGTRAHDCSELAASARRNPALQHLLSAAALLCLQGEPWLAVLQGHELDPAKQQEDQQRLLLERFQREVGWEVMGFLQDASGSVCLCLGFCGCCLFLHMS